MSHDKKDYTLSDWEEYLAPQVPQVELLGEIPISDEERKQIGRQLGNYFKTHWQEGRSSILANIHRRFPATFILFMVAQGIHGWSDSGFWPEVDEVTGHEFDPHWRGKLGQLFERILKEYRLSLFPDIGGYRYVTPILTHGGIPTHSLNDYFKYLLHPAVSRAWYADMSTDELIEDWLLGSYCNIADNSVSHFLESGGEIARDFVERSRELAREYQETGQVPEAEAVGLPRRVVENFYRWAVEEEGFKPGERREGSGFRFRRPILWLDPWGEGLTLELPAQQIPASHSQVQIEWHIQADGERLAILPVQIRRSGYDLRTEEKNFRLDKPASEYQVLLRLEDEEKHTWRYPGLTKKRPLLVFDAERQTLLRQGQSLPARTLWLLYPAEMELKFEGEAAKREQFPHLPWGWRPFTVEAWDLSQATCLILDQEGQTSCSIAVRPDEATRRPRLVGGRLYTASNLAATPLYIGQPPTVRVPLVGRSSLEEELSRWRISLRSKWTTQPQRDMVRPLAALLPHLRQTDNDEIELPLNLPDLLGESPIGNFVIRLRGPLGRDAELPLRILPHLEFIGHDELHLPNPETGPPEITLLFETDSETRLENQAKDENIQIEFEDGLYQVTVGAELDDVTLTAVHPILEREPVRVPLWIPLRRLRWTVIGTEKEQTWGGHLLKQPVDALLQTDAPLLLVDLGQGFRPTDAIPDTLTLRLLDVDNTILQIDEATISPRGRWRFELARFFDTIRHSDSPVMRFEVSCPYLPGHPEPVEQWVMSFSRLPVVDNVRVNIRFEVGLTVTLSWEERVRLRNQAVRIWSLWRPWQPPHEKKIPNAGEAGTLTFQTNQTDFLIGQYALEFIVVDPWRQSPEPILPSKNAPNVAIIETLTPAERIDQLNRAIEQFGPSLNMLIERACIQWQQGDRTAFWADVKQCHNHLKEATLSQLLTLADLVDKDGDEQQQTDIRLKLFAPDLFRRLLAQHRRGQLASGLFQRYLGYLPRSASFPLETSRLLLQLEDEHARLYAVQQLLRQNDPLGVDTIRQWLQQARLSEADAVALLNDNPLLTVKHLRPYLSEPAMVRILEQLSLDETVIIRPGYWVYSVAGWAKIKEIVDITEERAIEYFLPGQPGLRLRAILRPSYEARPIIITILDNVHRVQFEKQEKLYRCTKVEGCHFITPDNNLLSNKHNRASHGGIGPEFKIYQVDEPVFRSTDDLTYRRIAPPDMCG